MTSSITTQGNPFLRAADQLRQTGGIDRKTATAAVQPKTRMLPKAELNLIPDTDVLATRVDKAQQALSFGVRWGRGSILNLVV